MLDVCGVSGGDDSSCSRNAGTALAYSVGDPHYRTWDGAQFDIQPHTYWGEIVLVQHRRMGGGDIEVQTAAVPWGHNSWSESRKGHDLARLGGRERDMMDTAASERERMAAIAILIWKRAADDGVKRTFVASVPRRTRAWQLEPCGPRYTSHR